MSRRLFSLVLVLACVPMIARADENPYRSAKKGDWATYKTSTSFGAFKADGTMKQVVTAKDDKSLTLKISITSMGMELPAQEHKIDLTKPFDPSAAAVPGAGNAKVEKLGSGKETLEIGGKKYECEWVKNKMTIDANGMKIETETKVWTSKSVPLGGLVKMESKLAQGSSTMELTGSGNE
jgi:hypothetical protein